jgi:hypothetical protein
MPADHPDDWLDTESQSQLAANPPQKLAPPTVAGYSLVLLEIGANRRRVAQTLEHLIGQPVPKTPPCPCVVQRDLSLADAMQGQFELICADSISVFIDDDVLRNAKPEYLDGLFRDLRQSPEFQPVRLEVHMVPDGQRGANFLRQFFGCELKTPFSRRVARKKARIMQHWGEKIGALVEWIEFAGR